MQYEVNLPPTYSRCGRVFPGRSYPIPPSSDPATYPVASSKVLMRNGISCNEMEAPRQQEAHPMVAKRKYQRMNGGSRKASIQ
jgi:hypothetical protein